MKEGPPKLSKEEKEEAEKYGGTEEHDYKKKPGPHYSDKGGHKARGEYHYPNHLKHKK